MKKSLSSKCFSNDILINFVFDFETELLLYRLRNLFEMQTPKYRKATIVIIIILLMTACGPITKKLKIIIYQCSSETLDELNYDFPKTEIKC